MNKRFFKDFIDKIKNKAKNKLKGQAKWAFWEQYVSIKMNFMFRIKTATLILILYQRFYSLKN